VFILVRRRQSSREYGSPSSCAEADAGVSGQPGLVGKRPSLSHTRARQAATLRRGTMHLVKPPHWDWIQDGNPLKRWLTFGQVGLERPYALRGPQRIAHVEGRVGVVGSGDRGHSGPTLIDSKPATDLLVLPVVVGHCSSQHEGAIPPVRAKYPSKLLD